MHTPFYFRPPEFRYSLRSEPGFGWWTGVTRDDRQMLISRRGTLIFDRSGELLAIADESEYPVPSEWRAGPAVTECAVAWPTKMGFEECPIRVRRFWMPDRWLGIEDMPHELAEYFTSPSKFLARTDVLAEDAIGWRDSDQYMFHCGCDYIMSGRGGVEAS